MALRDSELAKPILMVLSDVDGVMTNGLITYDNAGVEIKSFHVRDGQGVKLWMQAGFKFGILTARNSNIVKIRAAELGVSILRQGFAEKLPAALDIFRTERIDPAHVCYIGDDIPDIPVMHHVGLAVAVADAAAEVKAVAKWTLSTPGGQGALRELIERLLKAKRMWDDLIPSKFLA
jgi:3-deoxy-D-manno-octulosonate 8-phosphate phosphatase (KDO 8-P phosphatase)